MISTRCVVLYGFVLLFVFIRADKLQLSIVEAPILNSVFSIIFHYVFQ